VVFSESEKNERANGTISADRRHDGKLAGTHLPGKDSLIAAFLAGEP
jgi:hypothetical protein